MRRFRAIAIVSMLVAVTAGPVGPVSAAPSKPVITVPAGDAAALYAAVYDGASSRSGVVIWLEGGTFELDPTMGPDGGRLVLGEGTELRSSLVLALDGHGVPTGGVAQPGAVLDTTLIVPPMPTDLGAVILGRGGTVSGISMTNALGSTIQALDIPESGLVERVLVEGHLVGVRARTPADRATTTGTIRESVLRFNGFTGVVVVHTTPFVPTADTTIRLTLERNLITDNGTFGVFINTGTRGSQRTNAVVHASHNVISDNGFAAYSVQGASDNNMQNSGANDNSTRLISRDDTIRGNALGVLAAAAVRLCSFIFGGCVFDATSLSNRNTVKVNLINTSFANNEFVDVVAEGVFSEDLGNDGDPVGQNNTTKVILANPTPSRDDLTTSAIDCLPVVDPCLNEATILPTGG